MLNLEKVGEKSEIEEKRNSLIADKVCKILKGKLQLNRKILETSKSKDCLSYYEFSSKLSAILKKLEQIEKDHPDRQYVELEYNNFMNCYAKKVILNDEDIDGLLACVRNSIMYFGICCNQREYKSNELVHFSLALLNDYISEKYGEEYKELSLWISFISSSPDASFFTKNDETYEVKGYGERYFTIKDGQKNIFVISEEGEVSIDEEPDYQKSLLNDELYLGCINYNGERIVTILYQKEGKYYPIFFDQRYNSYVEKIEQELKFNAKTIMSLSYALELKGLAYLIEPVYDKKMLKYLSHSFNESHEYILFTTSDLQNLENYPNEKIPSNELYLTKEGLSRQKESTNKIAKLNDILKISGLSYLIEENYDIKKLEYIMANLKEKKHVIPTITTEAQPPKKYILTEIFYDVYYNILNPIEKKIVKENEEFTSHSFIKPLEKKLMRGMDDGFLEKKLENFITSLMGYSVYNKYRDYVEKRTDNFEYFAGIRKYFENIIVNYNPNSGYTIYEFIDNYVAEFNEYIDKYPNVKILISALKQAYSDDPNDVIISHRDDTLIISRQDDKYKDDLPMTSILDIDSLEETLKEYIDKVKENDNYYKLLFTDDFGLTEQQAVEQLFLWTIRNAIASDLIDIERLFHKYIGFINDKTFEAFLPHPTKVGKVLDDELFIMLRKAPIAYETPYYLRFMLCRQVVEFANMRYGIDCEGDHPIAYIQAIQSSQEIPVNDAYFYVSNQIKKDLPKYSNFREFNPMHMASLVIFLGLINGYGIKEVHGADYLPLRYQRFVIEKNKNDEEMHLYQHRLTNKYINTFMRLLGYTSDVHLVKYPGDGDGFILKLDDDILFASHILQNLYDLGYKAAKEHPINNHYDEKNLNKKK